MIGEYAFNDYLRTVLCSMAWFEKEKEKNCTDHQLSWVISKFLYATFLTGFYKLHLLTLETVTSQAAPLPQSLVIVNVDHREHCISSPYLTHIMQSTRRRGLALISIKD